MSECRRPSALRERTAVVAGLLALALVVGACSAGEESSTPASTDAEDVAATSTTSTTTTTTLPPPPPEPTVLRPGDESQEVADLQNHLIMLGYDVPEATGVYDEHTEHAVMAFQKVHGLDRDGYAGPQTRTTMAAVRGLPHPIVGDGEPDRVEVDLARQVMFLYHGGALTKIISVSTGNNEMFCSEGRCRRAVTPTGRYEVGRRASGWETGPLGSLYNPLYFNQGIALHGSLSVPGHAASHGCVRVPMPTAEWLPDAVATGMAVYVLDGRTEGGIDEIPPPPPPPTPIPDLGGPPFETSTVF